MSSLHSCPRLAAEQSAKIGGIVSSYARGLSPQSACLADDAISEAWVRELERGTVPVFEPEGETTRRVVGWSKHLLRRWEAQGGQRQESAVRLHYLDDAAMARLLLEEYEMSAALDDYDVADLASFVERVLRPEQLHWLRVVRGELPWPTWPCDARHNRRRREGVRSSVTLLVRNIVADLLGPEGGKPEPKRPQVVHDPAPGLVRWQESDDLHRRWCDLTGEPRPSVTNRVTTGSTLDPATGLEWDATTPVVTDELRRAGFVALSHEGQQRALEPRPSLARYL